MKTQGASDLLNLASAAMASSALLLRRDKPQLAAQLVAKAARLNRFALDVPGERGPAAERRGQARAG